MYHILEALVRWISPILVFTADEIWKAMPGDRDETIFIQTWYQGLSKMSADSTVHVETWQQLSAIRVAVNKVIEENKQAKSVLNLTHDGNNNVIVQEELNANGDINHRVERKYDDENNMIESKVAINRHGQGRNEDYTIEIKYEFFD